jgi:hypothetical protein
MKRRLGRLALGAWLAAVLALGGALMVLHAPLPLPAALRVAPSGRHLLVHALSLHCPCSRRILDYLIARGSRRDADERVLLVDGDDATATRLRARGFAVEQDDAQTLSQRHDIEAVPLLVIVRPDGTVAYRGGHTPRPQMAPVDLTLLDEVRHGAVPRPLAVFGCAVARDLQRRLDPMGLKYLWWR